MKPGSREWWTARLLEGGCLGCSAGALGIAVCVGLGMAVLATCAKSLSSGSVDFGPAWGCYRFTLSASVVILAGFVMLIFVLTRAKARAQIAARQQPPSSEDDNSINPS